MLQGTTSTAEYLSRHVEAAPKKLQHSQYWSQSGRDTWVEKARSLQSKYSDKLAAVMQKGVAFHHGGKAFNYLVHVGHLQVLLHWGGCHEELHQLANV